VVSNPIQTNNPAQTFLADKSIDMSTEQAIEDFLLRWRSKAESITYRNGQGIVINALRN